MYELMDSTETLMRLTACITHESFINFQYYTAQPDLFCPFAHGSQFLEADISTLQLIKWLAVNFQGLSNHIYYAVLYLCVDLIKIYAKLQLVIPT